MPRRYPLQLIKKMRSLYIQGNGQRAIGKQLGIPWQSVWPHIKSIPLTERKKFPKRGTVLPIPPHAHFMSEEKARIIGYLMGDGCVMSVIKHSHHTSRNGKRRYSYLGAFVAFYNKDNAVVQRFRSDCKYVYGICPKYNSNRMEIKLRRRAIFEDLKKYGSFGSFSWRFPQEISANSSKVKREFIKAFYDSESYVEITPTHNRIVLYSANLSGLRQFRSLLGEFGIISYINGPYAGTYRLKISDKNSLRTFHNKIGFYHSQKKKALCRLMTRI